MAELLTPPVMAEVLDDLRLAWRVRITEKDIEGTVRTWHAALTGLTAEAVRTAARRCIQTNERFPAVKEVRELALDFMARTGGLTERRREANPNGCPICGATYEHHEVTRKKIDVVDLGNGKKRYVDVLDEKGQPIWETVTSPRQEIYHDRAAHHLADGIPA